MKNDTNCAIPDDAKEFMNCLQSPVIITDLDLYVIVANKWALDNYPALALPDGFLNLISSNDKDKIIHAVKRNRTVTISSLDLIADLSVTISPLQKDEKVCGCFITLASIHERDVMDDRESVTRMISKFSGQFRNPLTIMFSTLSLLSKQVNTLSPDGSNTETTIQNYMDVINQNCYSILRTVNNITDLARHRNGMQSLHLKNMDIVEFLFELCSAIASLIEIPFTFSLPSKPLYVHFDEKKIASVVLNLVSNACLYTRPGNKIHLVLTEKDDQALVSLKDTGIGISDEDLPHLFEPYWTGSTTTLTGIGLGLTLCKCIITLHGGTMAVTSELAVGTTVAFTIPFDQEDSKEATKYVASSYSDYICDKFSQIYVELADCCQCPQL